MTKEQFDRAQFLKEAISALESLIRYFNSMSTLDTFELHHILSVVFSGPVRKDLLDFAYAKKEEYEKEFNSL